MSPLDERVTHLEEQMENQATLLIDLRAAVRDLHLDLRDLRTDMNRRFERIDERFERNDRRFERIDDKLDRNLMWVVGILMAIVIAIASVSLQVARL
jgi:predicted  nucleic acid-binding Zn-ribbon protein